MDLARLEIAPYVQVQQERLILRFFVEFQDALLSSVLHSDNSLPA